jgi:hypothetical protein
MRCVRSPTSPRSGQWPAGGSLAVLLAYLMVFGLTAARLSRWE